MKVRIKCKNCGYTWETDLQLSPLGSLKPGKKGPLSRIKIDKGSLDKILDIAAGASRDDLEKLGLEIDIEEWEDAVERLALRKFLLENLRVCREKKQKTGEKYVVGTEPFVMGDSFKDVDIPSSEVKSLGVEDLRMIPGVTLQKKVYSITRGRDEEELKGIKCFVIIDGSGSMITGKGLTFSGGKIGKALLIGKEIYEITKKFGFDYQLALFSDAGVRVPKEKLREFWADASERANYRIWNGGTRLQRGLEQFTEQEYRDANLIVISDMDLGDFQETKDEILKISKLTNSFKIIIIETQDIDLVEREKQVREIFPPEAQLQIMVIPLSEGS